MNALVAKSENPALPDTSSACRPGDDRRDALGQFFQNPIARFERSLPAVCCRALSHLGERHHSNATSENEVADLLEAAACHKIYEKSGAIHQRGAGNNQIKGQRQHMNTGGPQRRITAQGFDTIYQAFRTTSVVPDNNN